MTWMYVVNRSIDQRVILGTSDRYILNLRYVIKYSVDLDPCTMQLLP